MSTPFRVPDPSATIPDFGPHPDLEAAKARAKARAKAAREGQAPSSKPISAPLPVEEEQGMSPVVLVLIGAIVAMIAGGFGFLFVVIGGLGLWFVAG